MEFTPQQIKRLERIARIEKNPTLEIVDELAKVKNVLKKVSDKEVIFPEQREEITISNPEDIKNDIIDEISQVKGLIEKYIASKMAVDAQKEVKMVKHTSEKEKSLCELKIAIIEAIQNLAENIPEQKDYSGQIKQILNSLTGKKELNLKSLEEGLDKILKAVDTPDFLNDIVEYNRVKVSLSDEQIKKLGKSMSVSFASGSGFPGSSQADLKRIADNQGNINSAGNTVISTYLDKFRDDFDIFDTTNNWTVIQQGANHTISVAGVANGARYLNINSSTGANQETIISSKIRFTLPFKVAVGLSISNRPANGTLQQFFEIVEVDPITGAVIKDTTIASAPFCNNARNCASWLFDAGAGSSAGNGKYNVRTAGISEKVSANVAISTTTATGTTPNFIQASNFVITALNDAVSFQSFAINSLAAGGNAKITERSIDPTKTYAIRIRLKSVGTPVNTDFRIHSIRVMDASRVSVDFAMIEGGGTDIQRSIPVAIATSTTLPISETPSTTSGIATYFSLVSANSINATNIKATAALLNSCSVKNRADATCWVKLYNVAATPNPATDTPIITEPIFPGQTADLVKGRFADRFTVGLGIIISGQSAPTDTTAVEAGAVSVNLSYA